MKKLSFYEYTDEELQAHSNKVIDRFIDVLHHEGVIDSELHEKLQDYNIVITKKNAFRRFIEKVLRSDIKNSDSSLISVVKVLGVRPKKEDASNKKTETGSISKDIVKKRAMDDGPNYEE